MIKTILILLLPCVIWADSVTRRPNADGTYDSDWGLSAGATQWQLVDEAVSDDDGTYVYEASNNQRFSCVFPTTPAVPTGATDISVAVYYNSKKQGAIGDPETTPFLRFSATNLGGNEDVLTTSYVVYPDTIGKPGGGSWTVAEINGTAWEAGVNKTSPSGTARCTQLWVVISYTPAATDIPRGIIIEN
jgi:hypothetical protein